MRETDSNDITRTSDERSSRKQRRKHFSRDRSRSRSPIVQERRRRSRSRERNRSRDRKRESKKKSEHRPLKEHKNRQGKYLELLSFKEKLE